MSVSSVSSYSAYQLQWSSLSQTDSTDKSGAPSDPLQALFNAFTGGGQADAMGAPPPPPDGSSSGGCSQFSSDTMSTMISMLGGSDSSTSPLDSLVGKFDSDGDGKISQSEFETAMGTDADKTKADALFAKMDKNGDGTVTKDELAQAIQKAHGHHHHHDDDVKSFVFKATRPFDPAKLEDFLGAMVNVYGPRMLRYKGVLHMKGTERKVIFQGVHQLMGSDLGPEWAAGEERMSKMVFIGIELPKDIFLQGLEQCLN